MYIGPLFTYVFKYDCQYSTHFIIEKMFKHLFVLLLKVILLHLTVAWLFLVNIDEEKIKQNIFRVYFIL